MSVNSNWKEQRTLHRVLSKERKKMEETITATDGGKLYSATLTLGLPAALFPVAWHFSRSSICNSLDNSRGLKPGRRRSALAFRLVNATRSDWRKTRHADACASVSRSKSSNARRLANDVWWTEAEVVPPMAATKSVRLHALRSRVNTCTRDCRRHRIRERQFSDCRAFHREFKFSPLSLSLSFTFQWCK